MDLDSALLRAFVTVADELHFGRAAEALFISQQGLSKRILRLEAILGCTLLDRDRRGVALTDAGRLLLPEARKAVDAVEAAAAVVAQGSLGLSVDVLDEHLSMLSRVRAFADLRPDLALSAVMRHGVDALQTLRKGGVDVALGRPGALAAPWPTDIHGCAVFAEPIELLVPVGHRLDRKTVTMQELVGEPLWFPTASAPAEWTDLLDELVETFQLSVEQSGATFGFAHWLGEVATGSAPATLVGAGMLLPPGLPLTRVSILDPTPVFWWWAMWRGRRPASRMAALIPALVDDSAVVGSVWMPTADRAHLPAKR